MHAHSRRLYADTPTTVHTCMYMLMYEYSRLRVTALRHPPSVRAPVIRTRAIMLLVADTSIWPPTKMLPRSRMHPCNRSRAQLHQTHLSAPRIVLAQPRMRHTTTPGSTSRRSPLLAGLLHPRRSASCNRESGLGLGLGLGLHQARVRVGLRRRAWRHGRGGT